MSCIRGTVFVRSGNEGYQWYVILIEPSCSLTCHCWIITQSLQGWDHFSHCIFLAGCISSWVRRALGSNYSLPITLRPGPDWDLSLFAGSFVLTFLQMATMDRQSMKQTKQYFFVQILSGPSTSTPVLLVLASSSPESGKSPTRKPIITFYNPFKHFKTSYDIVNSQLIYYDLQWAEWSDWEQNFFY